MTRSEIRALCRKMLGETTAAYWTDAELNGYIDDACRDIAYRSKCIKKNAYITSLSCTQNTVAAVSNEYTITDYITDLYSILDVYFFQDGDSWEKLEPTTKDVLDIEEPGWKQCVGYTTGATYNYNATTGTPTKYYWDREEDVLGLHIPPDSTNAGVNYIRLYYAAQHTALTTDGSTPDVAEPLHLAIVDFVVATGFGQRGWGDRANDAWSKYFQKIQDYRVERHREREDEDIIMRNYRNI